MKFETTSILGAGSWGAALAVLWAKDGRDIILWGRNPAGMDRLRDTRASEYLPGVRIPPSIRITSDLNDCASASVVVFVTPSTAFPYNRRKLSQRAPK